MNQHHEHIVTRDLWITEMKKKLCKICKGFSYTEPKCKLFYNSPDRIVEVYQNIYFQFKNEQTNKQRTRQKAKETKERKRTSVEKLRG